MAINDSIEIIVGGIAILSVLYRVAQTERIIYQQIDSVRDTAERNYLELQRRLDVHLQDYANKKLQDERNHNDMYIEVKGKYYRVREHQKDIERYLSKTGNFRVRTHYTGDYSYEDKNE